VAIGSVAVILLLGIYFNWPISQDGRAQSQIAPEFVAISGYINTPPITLASLHGHVVLLHFWRIGCGECQQDIPYLNYIYQKYHAYGLVIISIHSAQSQDEMSQANVQQYVQQNGIKYPVLMDNQRQTFQEYGDYGTPRDTIVNKAGYITNTHLGTGDNYQREEAIRTAMALPQ